MKKTRDLQKIHNRNHGVSRTEGLSFPLNGGYFPDSVSSRASRHVKELETLVKDGAQWLSSASVEWVVFSWFYFATEEGNWWYINTKTLQSRGICCLFGEKRYRDLCGPKRGLARQCSPFCTSWSQICWSLSPLVQVWMFYLSCLFKISR